MHVEAHDLPTFAIRRPAGNRRFLYGHEKIDEQKVDLFCQDFLDGKLTPDTKSEPVPTDHQGHVVNITASTFDDLVLKSDKDVLVDYYTQWCGRCKAMAPAYESLAKLYASDPEGSAKVTIGKIDVEANYVEFSVRRYPTIKLYPAEKKDEAIVYLGSRMTEDMAGFVREHGYHKVEAFHASKEA
jgi:protein disulfide-isomerase A1